MGTAIGGAQRGGSANIYYECVLRIAHERHQDVARLLAYAMAHEMGHLLLRYPTHAAAGIMRPNWDSDDLRRIAGGSLTFTPIQANAIRAQLSERLASIDAATRSGLTLQKQ
jgi:hypothetical protein